MTDTYYPSSYTFSTRLILEAATELGVAWRSIPETNVIELIYNGVSEFFTTQIHPRTTQLADHISNDKACTKQFLKQNGISTPIGLVIKKADPVEKRASVFRSLTTPLVIKPAHGQHGDQVHLNITQLDDFLSRVEEVIASDDDVVVEQQLAGKEYRILATRDKVIGVINRVPANVVGDGHHTIAQLIEIKNSDPRRGDGYEKALLKIIVDDVVLKQFSSQSLTLESIPNANHQVLLRPNTNLSTGGDSIDVTDEIHSSVTAIIVQAMRAIPGLHFAGIDFITQDITQPQTTDSYAIIEINRSPMLSMHDYPYQGKKRNAAQEFILTTFPELRTISK